MVLLAAFQTLLYRYTGQNDICVGSPIANRQYGETEGLIGMFVNTLAMRSQVEGEDTFAALLSRVKTTCLEAWEHQDAPFEKVVDILQPERNLAITPIFQVMMLLQNVETGLGGRFPRYRLDAVSANLTSRSHLRKGRMAWPRRSITVQICIKPDTIARMAGHFTALCRAITAAPTARVCDLEYVSEAEKHRLLTGFNHNPRRVPDG